jgi:predicted Fe-Mo cluster-binding NifX family protein
MKIAIPSETGDGLAAMRSGHFGHAAYMTVIEYDEDMNIIAVEAIKNVDHDEMGCGGVIAHVLGLGVDGILAAGMGRPPLMRFTENGVIVYAETSTPNVGDAARLFAEGRVQRMSPEAACNHH